MVVVGAVVGLPWGGTNPAVVLGATVVDVVVVGASVVLGGTVVVVGAAVVVGATVVVDAGSVVVVVVTGPMIWAEAGPAASATRSAARARERTAGSLPAATSLAVCTWSGLRSAR
jgi:hypothetical protein